MLALRGVDCIAALVTPCSFFVYLLAPLGMRHLPPLLETAISHPVVYV